MTEAIQGFSSPGTGDAATVGVLVLHGFTGNPTTSRPLGEALARRGWAVEVPCLPGHGTRWQDMMKTTYADWRGAAERALDALRSRCDTVVVGGLSMGGTISLDLATRRRDDVHGVFAINAAILDREGLLAKLAPIISKIIPAAPASSAGLVKNDIAKPGQDERAYAWVPAAAGYSLVKELPRIRARVSGLEQPILVMWSREDHSVPPENSRALLRLLGSRDVTEVVLERSYHVATLDHDAPLIEEKVAALVERVASARAGVNMGTARSAASG